MRCKREEDGGEVGGSQLLSQEKGPREEGNDVLSSRKKTCQSEATT